MSSAQYALLGLQPFLRPSIQDADRAYKRLALLNHPDRSTDINATAKFQALNAAHTAVLEHIAARPASSKDTFSNAETAPSSTNATPSNAKATPSNARSEKHDQKVPLDPRREQQLREDLRYNEHNTWYDEHDWHGKPNEAYWKRVVPLRSKYSMQFSDFMNFVRAIRSEQEEEQKERKVAAYTRWNFPGGDRKWDRSQAWHEKQDRLSLYWYQLHGQSDGPDIAAKVAAMRKVREEKEHAMLKRMELSF